MQKNLKRKMRYDLQYESEYLERLLSYRSRSLYSLRFSNFMPKKDRALSLISSVRAQNFSNIVALFFKHDFFHTHE